MAFFPGHVAIYLGNGKIVHATDIRKQLCDCQFLWEGEPGYQEDLKNSLCAAGSIFKMEKSALTQKDFLKVFGGVW